MNTPSLRCSTPPTPGLMCRLRRPLGWVLLTMLTTALCCVACAPKKDEEGGEPGYLGEGAMADELPVTRVALYQNGVGYFERRGRVEGDAITLRIRPDQINDILKSLTVIDLGKGQPVSISLPVDRHAVDQLASLPRQIRDEGGMLSLLDAFRGARVSLTAGTTVQGRVVGTESLAKLDKNGNSVDVWRVTIKQDDGALAVVALEDVTSMRIHDRTLEVGLEKSLDISLNEGSWKPIELTVRMSDPEPKNVVVSYIVAMPIWKPAYRLVLGNGDEGLFQGWAVVDNVSGSDWVKVSMALIAGTPMSFLYDLYSPQFVSRPDLTPRGERYAVAPVRTESARDMAPPKPAPSRSRKKSQASSAPAASPGSAWGDSDSDGRGYGGEAAADASGEEYDEYLGYKDSANELAKERESFAKLDMDDFAADFQAMSEGSEVSALFQYDISNPVTVPDRSSALVNLVQYEGTAKEIVLFRPELWVNYDALTPYRAVQFQNTSGYALEPGPITLNREGTFIGEGFLSRTEKDSVAFVTFAMDPQVTLKNSRTESEEAAKIMRIHGGSIESEIKSVTTVTYEIKNQRDVDAVAMIRRPIRAGWTMDPMPEDVLEAAGAYFISVKVPAGQKVEHTIREVTPVRRSVTLDSTLALELLKLHISDPSIAPELKQPIEEVIAKRAELNAVIEELHGLRVLKTDLEDEARRIAYSLGEIKDIKEPSAKKLREQLVKRASELETDIGTHSTRIAELSLKESDLGRTLRALFGAVTFERDDK